MMNNDESTPLTTLFPFHSLSSQPLAHSPHLGLQATFSHQSTDSLSLVFYGHVILTKKHENISVTLGEKCERPFLLISLSSLHLSFKYVIILSYLFNSLHHNFPSKSPEILRAPGQVAVQGFAGYLWGPARWRWSAQEPKMTHKAMVIYVVTRDV
jgi:hypothetical protein